MSVRFKIDSNIKLLSSVMQVFHTGRYTDDRQTLETQRDIGRYTDDRQTLDTHRDIGRYTDDMQTLDTRETPMTGRH